MRYIDSGTRDQSQALGYWLRCALNEEVVELRWQTGFFGLDGVGFFLPVVERLIREERLINVLIGSNEPGTLRNDVEQLMTVLGIPGSRASQLGIVSFYGSFFHPKTYHFRYADGSQSAYVGSANLTAAGVGSLHVEAGMILDTREGDPVTTLSQIACAIDEWFTADREGFTLVTDTSILEELTADGILATTLPPRTSSAGGGERAPRRARPRLRPLISIPDVPSQAALSQPPAVAPTVPISAPRAEFPDYLLFEPNATVPTRGALALSGTMLPSSAVGLVVRLSRDSSRLFAGGSGTSNITIPVSTAGTFRFGIFRGKFERPRAEFELAVRYVANSQTLRINQTSTNIMVYGVIQGESGHFDIRMVIPAIVRRALAQDVINAGLRVPVVGDFAFLEWPTVADPILRLTFLEPGSQLFLVAESLFRRNEAMNQLVGKGTCWLPANVSPIW